MIKQEEEEEGKKKSQIKFRTTGNIKIYRSLGIESKFSRTSMTVSKESGSLRLDNQCK